jgi:hypothetical protein
MKMFDPEFFPTPRALADKMFEPYRKLIEDGTIGSILDPEAGKGDLLKPVLRMRDRPRLYAIEKSVELRGVLSALETVQSYGRDSDRPVHVLGDDVFSYQGRHVFDLILSNPPFSRGAEHVLRAWELLASGGQGAFLLNAETVRNPHTSARQQLADLIRQHGTTEELGAAFARSERPTDVDVVLVRLHKPAAADAFNFSRAERERNAPRPIVAEELENAIARKDIVGNAAIAFDLAARALTELSQAWKRADHYLSAAGVSISELVPVEGRALAQPDQINELLDAAQTKAWHSIINRSEIERYFTAKMRKDFDEFMAGQGKLDFNKANVLSLFETIFLSRHSIADAAVADVFDQMCSYDPSNKVEGWKTNSGHKVNEKVILPHFIVFEWGKFRLSYHRDYSALADIDKALCHVTGENYATIRTIDQTLRDVFEPKQSRMAAALGVPEGTRNAATSEFFELKFFKKGTLHLRFRSRKVWEMFNVAAAKGKGWIGTTADEASARGAA